MRLLFIGCSCDILRLPVLRRRFDNAPVVSVVAGVGVRGDVGGVTIDPCML